MEYLGDSVYVDFDGNYIRLTTDNGAGPSNIIYLEPEVIINLMKYLSETLPAKIKLMKK